MSKSDAKWQALDERLAREVMGCCKWDDIPLAERDVILQAWLEEILAEASPEWRAFALESLRAFWWQHHPEYGWIHAYDCRDWQPHEDVAQALGVLKALQVKILEHQGWATATLTIRLSPGRCRLKVANILGPRADDVPKVICLTAEQWANAQKEVQGELD